MEPTPSRWTSPWLEFPHGVPGWELVVELDARPVGTAVAIQLESSQDGSEPNAWGEPCWVSAPGCLQLDLGAQVGPMLRVAAVPSGGPLAGLRVGRRFKGAPPRPPTSAGS